MKRIILLLVLVTSTGLSQKIRVPPVTRHTLDNGLTVILMQYRKVPVVHFRLVARGGSAADPSGREGVASMGTSLMREGTTTRSSNEIATAIDFTGGSLFAAAGADYCAVRGEVLKKDVNTGLDLFADILLNPSFPEEELERERRQRLAGFDALKEEPGSIASRVFTQSLYDPHPYGKQVTRTSVDAITREDLVEFHRSVFRPDNSVLVVAGDFEDEEMLALLRQKFSSWQRGEASAHPLPLPARHTGRRLILVDKADATQTQVRMGNIGIDMKSPDFFAVAVANSIFGSGFTSRLVEELRVRRSLTYSASSNFPANLYGGSFSISTFTKVATTAEIIDAILDEIRKFREQGATPEELQKAQNYLAGAFARGLQSPEALASRMTDIELYGFPADHLETYIQRMKSVTLADVRRVAEKYFVTDDLLLVLVAPADSTRGAVGKYGEMTVMSLDEAVK